MDLKQLQELLEKVDKIVWGPAMLVLLMGKGVFLTIRMNFLTWRNLPYALKLVFGKEAQNAGNGGISPFSALMTSLAATIGTGNIVGVATAMVLGGPGAIVWMCLSACFGLSTKFAECMLAVNYRTINEDGEFVGGPMYTMKAWKHKIIGQIMGIGFAVFTVLASFGIGNMTQANSISSALITAFHIPKYIVGIILMFLVFIITIGGISSISKVSKTVVPMMAVFYIVAGIIVIIGNIEKVPEGLIQIFSSAFSISSITGGAGGTIITGLFHSMHWGIARGIFSNEAGMGSAAIAAAAAKTNDPVKQGYINMTGTFFDTILVCSVTGLLIASSGMLGVRNEAGELLEGAALTMAAFYTVLGNFGVILVSISLVMFAFSTIIGWEYLGEKAFEYLWKGKQDSIIIYRILFSFITCFGAVTTVKIAWSFSDIANGLMAIPNLICILVMSNQVVYASKEYQKKL